MLFVTKKCYLIIYILLSFCFCRNYVDESVCICLQQCTDNIAVNGEVDML